MNMTAWAKPLDMPIKAPNIATAMTATSKTVIPSCSLAPYTLRDLLALTPRRPFEGAVGRLKARHKVGQMLDFVNGDALGRAQRGANAGPAARHEGAAEAQLGRLAQARLALADRTDLAAQADLAEHHHLGRHRLVGERRHHGRRHGEVGRRLADAQAAGDVEIDVVGADRDGAARLEHGQ